MFIFQTRKPPAGWPKGMTIKSTELKPKTIPKSEPELIPEPDPQPEPLPELEDAYEETKTKFIEELE